MRRQSQAKRRGRRLTGIAGVDFVTCRICGDRRRVINSQHLSRHETDRPTYMDEYELGPDQLVAKAFRVLQSSRPGFKPNGKAEWVAEIKTIYKKKGLAGLCRLQKNHKYLYEQGLWLFGSVDDGFRFVGLNPESIGLHGSWEDERLHREIWNLRRQKLPLYPNYVMKHHQKVLSHALAGYGSWAKALIAHGIKPPPKRYRLHLLIRLRDSMESAVKITKAFCLELEYYFGSVEKAKLELKTDKRILNGWGPKRVVVEIQKRHRLKLSLTYSVVRVEFPALVGAAETYFGSWGRALSAAGIDPNLYFVQHTWRTKRRKVLPLRIRRNPELLASKVLRSTVGQKE